MSFVVFALAWLAFNLFFAALCAFLARRWGRDPFGWVLTAVFLGPLAVLALAALHRDDLRRGRQFAIGGTTGAGGPGLKVLLAVDGSAPSQRAVEWVVEHLGSTTGEATVATVLPLERGEAVSMASESPRRQELESEISASVDAACQTLQAAGIRCRPVTRFGDPGGEIITLADEGSYDLIVLGRKGRGAVAKFLLGSVSEKVVKGAGQPVMVVD
jgi:nucleotide-binding universal stress UspA family protein